MESLFVRQHFGPLKDNLLYPIGKVIVSFPDPENLIVEKVDHRDFASVYFVNYQQQKLVLKWMYLDEDDSTITIEKEIDLQLKAAAHGLAPAVRYAFLFQLGGVILADRLDLELATYLTNSVNSKLVSDQLLISIINLVERLHNLEIYHGDLSASNIMLKFNAEEPEKFTLQFIDFGRSELLSAESTGSRLKFKRMDYRSLSGDLYDLYRDVGYPHLEEMFLRLQALSQNQ
jgi:tRNA A-37 threonylcarbamoyl transferase component Bud32